MALVVLDAGHGGENPGAVYRGRQEKDDALSLAMAIGRILDQVYLKKLLNHHAF